VDVLALLDEIQAIARTGLNHADNPYDRERYERLLTIAAEEYSTITGLADDEIRARFARELGSITPKVGADLAIFDDDDRILLVLRTDDQRWGLVAGWVEPGEPPSRTVVREAKEEVGLDVRVDALADVVWRPPSAAAGPHSTVSVVYLGTVVGGEITAQPHEVIEARYWNIDEVPAWHLNHEQLARAALAARERAR
jgi:ADP-ribose pyrophosphatase YjhB (NUDIX family)